MRLLYGLAVVVLSVGAGVAAAAQNLPAGTHSVDDHSQENAVAARIAAAESALEKGDFRGAEDALKVLASERPKDAQVQYDLGFAAERTGEEDLAVKAYGAAIAADATLAQPRVALGLLEARGGKTDAARRDLLVAAEMSEAAPELRGRALRALAQMDEDADPAKATDELLAAIQLTGETPADTQMSAELAAKSGDHAGAEMEFRKTLAADPGDVDAAVGLGRALKAEGKLADAEKVLADAMAAHPDDVRLVAQLATVYAAEGKDAQAIPLIETLRAKDGAAANDPAVGSMLARLYSMNNRDADAEALYRKLLAAAPDDPVLEDALGSVLVKEAKYAEAEQVLAKAVRQREAFHNDVAWGEATSHLAFAASRNKQPDVVLQALSARATVLPETPVTLFLQATAHDSLHQFKDAVRLYKAFLAVSGGKFPDEEFEARHRIIALQHER